MQIQVTEVGGIESAMSKKGKPYKKFMLEFLTDGRAGKYTITEYNKVYDTLLKSSSGEEFEISTETDGEYTNWVKATKVVQTESAGTKVSATKPAAPFKSTYETPEERAKKQVYIVRQSSIANAIALAGVGPKNTVSTEKILDIARQFEEYVFGTGGEIVSDDLDDIEVK